MRIHTHTRTRTYSLAFFQVRRLKEQICEVEGIQPEQIRIVVKGKQLKDENTLMKSKVNAKSRVSIVLSLRTVPAGLCSCDGQIPHDPALCPSTGTSTEF